MLAFDNQVSVSAASRCKQAEGRVRGKFGSWFLKLDPFFLIWIQICSVGVRRAALTGGQLGSTTTRFLFCVDTPVASGSYSRDLFGSFFSLAMSSFIAGLPSCAWCGFLVVSRNSRCPCKTVWYCEAWCQLLDWENHRPNCAWRARRMDVRAIARMHALDKHIGDLLWEYIG